MIGRLLAWLRRLGQPKPMALTPAQFLNLLELYNMRIGPDSPPAAAKPPHKDRYL